MHATTAEGAPTQSGAMDAAGVQRRLLVAAGLRPRLRSRLPGPVLPARHACILSQSVLRVAGWTISGYQPPVRGCGSCAKRIARQSTPRLEMAQVQYPPWQLQQHADGD